MNEGRWIGVLVFGLVLSCSGSTEVGDPSPTGDASVDGAAGSGGTPPDDGGEGGTGGTGGTEGTGGTGGTPQPECLTLGGVCGSVPVIADPCVVCPAGFVPADSPDTKLGCKESGAGGGAPYPHCCLPSWTTGACAEAGGECYLATSGVPPCPPGWEIDESVCEDETTGCCVPGDACK